MNNFGLEIWDDESRLVTFYTIRVDGNEFSETDKFLRKYQNDPKYRDALEQLLSLLLDVMGEQQGAHPAFFTRRENRAQALPPSHAYFGEIELRYPQFPLRLFCYRVNESLVILFNGSAKTAGTVQQSKKST